MIATVVTNSSYLSRVLETAKVYSWEIFFLPDLFQSHSFCQKPDKGKLAKKIFFFSYFRFDGWSGVWTRALRLIGQHTIDYDDFTSVTIASTIRSSSPYFSMAQKHGCSNLKSIWGKGLERVNIDFCSRSISELYELLNYIYTVQCINMTAVSRPFH